MLKYFSGFISHRIYDDNKINIRRIFGNLRYLKGKFDHLLGPLVGCPAPPKPATLCGVLEMPLVLRADLLTSLTE